VDWTRLGELLPKAGVARELLKNATQASPTISYFKKESVLAVEFAVDRYAAGQGGNAAGLGL
jgi:hypothetical protein